jgi:hypothetical protein
VVSVGEKMLNICQRCHLTLRGRIRKEWANIESLSVPAILYKKTHFFSHNEGKLLSSIESFSHLVWGKTQYLLPGLSDSKVFSFFFTWPVLKPRQWTKTGMFKLGLTEWALGFQGNTSRDSSHSSKVSWQAVSRMDLGLSHLQDQFCYYQFYIWNTM